MTGQKSYGTGDLNLGAAIATMGIRPDPKGPIELIARDNGRDYTRFHFAEESDCGEYSPMKLSGWWASPEAFKKEFPAHPFGMLMDFISSRPKGCSNQDEWLCHASLFLGIPVDAVRKSYKDIGRTCSASPESPVSYVCAFIRNRVDMITATKQRASKGHFSNMQDRSKSVSIIPANAPKRIRDYLLSHIR